MYPQTIAELTQKANATAKNHFRDRSFPDFSIQFFAGTENTLKMMKDLKIEWMLDYMTPESIGPLWRRRISTIVALFNPMTSKSPP